MLATSAGGAANPSLIDAALSSSSLGRRYPVREGLKKERVVLGYGARAKEGDTL